MKLKYNELIFDMNGDVNLDNYYTKSECDICTNENCKRKELQENIIQAINIQAINIQAINIQTINQE